MIVLPQDRHPNGNVVRVDEPQSATLVLVASGVEGLDDIGVAILFERHGVVHGGKEAFTRAYVG